MTEHEIREKLTELFGNEIDKQTADPFNGQAADVILPVNSIDDFEDVDLEGFGLLITLNNGTTFELEIRQQQ